MKPPLNRSTVLRAALAVGLALAAVATGRPLVERAERVAAAPATSGDALTLDGSWTTFANGDRINRLVRDGDVLWSATDGGGLVRWDLTTDRYRQYLAPQHGLPANTVYDIEPTDDGRLWLATQRGLVRFDPVAGHAEHVYAPPAAADMPARVVTALERAPDGRLWVGFAQEWDPDTVDPISEEPGTFIPGGLARFDPTTEAWDHEVHVEREERINASGERFLTIPSENVTDLAYDTEGTLWVGTRPYLVWDETQVAQDPGAPTVGAWVTAGGGLASFDADGEWLSYRPSQDGQEGGCYSVYVTDLESDVDGRMWVGTVGHGALLMDPERQTGGRCGNQVYYTRARHGYPGLPGRTVWAIDVDEQGRVWMGVGESGDEGKGVAVLSHNGTFDDSSASDAPWQSDDLWVVRRVDGDLEDGPLLVSALAVGQPGVRYLGTRDDRYGDGFGVRRYDEASDRWTPLRTAAAGLPSNQIIAIARHPRTGAVWFTLRNRGVARYDPEAGWDWWRAFGRDDEVARTTGPFVPSARDNDRVPVDIADQAAFDDAFPEHPRYARIGRDPTLYRIKRFDRSAGVLRVTPDVQRAFAADTPVYNVRRGPASDTATQLAFDPDPERGVVYAGGRETMWESGGAVSEACAAHNECWIDGGVGAWDGERWSVYNQLTEDEGVGLPDQEVQALEVDLDGRLWVGTGHPLFPGNSSGIGVLDPASGSWTVYTSEDEPGLGSNGIADFAVDPETGHIWTAHHASKVCRAGPTGEPDCTFAGGGVARFDGASWTSWRKRAGAELDAFGEDGELRVVAVDRTRDLILAGGWAAADAFHWNQGRGLDAVLNWCPVDDCTNTAWQSRRWPDDGPVRAVTLDAEDRVWVGAHRDGNGVVPQPGGVKLSADLQTWAVVRPSTSGLVSREISALEPDGERMWIGTLRDGVSLYDDRRLPTPTPTRRPVEPTSTTVPATSTAPPETTPTVPVQGTQDTPTPTADATAQGSRTPGPAPSATPGGVPRWHTVYLPFAWQHASCSPCPPRTPRPTPTRPTVTPRPSATAASSASPTAGPTSVGPSPTGAAPTTTPSATATAPSAGSVTPSPTVRRVASATPRPSATPTAAVTPVPTPRPPAQWRLFDGTAPDVDYHRVVGAPDGQTVWFLGASGTALVWDGQAMRSAPNLPPVEEVGWRDMAWLTEARGFIVGDDGLFYETSNGGVHWRRVRTSPYADDWRGIDLVREGDQTRGWVVGADRGARLMYDGSSWSPPSVSDRQTSHPYTAVEMLNTATAFATRADESGARMMTWDGTSWRSGAVTGVLNDLHVRGATSGMAVGDRGDAWWLTDQSEWARMAERPLTRGGDLLAVHVVSDDEAWAGGVRTKLYHWDGVGWTEQTLQVPKLPSIRSIWIAPNGYEGWAVGDDGLVLRYGP